jgi:hypothetical protein
LIFNPVNGESFSVNPIGIEIINLIREGKSQDEIFKSITSKYNTDKSTIERDLHDFITVLKNYNLIEEDGQKKA